MVSIFTIPSLDEPQMFNKACNHPNEESWKWQEAICKEFIDMSRQQVWQKTLKSLISPTCRCIKNKWVFKIKSNWVYWEHLVAYWYSPVPGINFSKNYSPVVDDIIFWILLLMVIHFGYSAKIVNMETTYLYGELEEEIYMVSPRNVWCRKKWCHHFKQVHLWPCSTRKYYKKTIKILKNSGFIGGNVNPSLYIKKIAKGIV